MEMMAVVCGGRRRHRANYLLRARKAMAMTMPALLLQLVPWRITPAAILYTIWGGSDLQLADQMVNVLCSRPISAVDAIALYTNKIVIAR